MKTPEYPISEDKKVSKKEIKQEFNVPIIDVIRHGETDRRQDRHGNYLAPRLNVNEAGFKLDPEYLDINDKGITTIETTANQLADSIDKENEVILLVSSPAWRTHSSALVFEKVFRDKGINILNAEKDPKFFKGIDQDSAHFFKILDQAYGTPENPKDSDVDVTKETQKAENINFQRFLRHMNNIYRYLSPETLAKLKGRRLRIVTFAHAETTMGFIDEVFPEGTQLQSKGQILEITPKSQLKADKKTTTDVKLYPNKERPDEKSARITRGFSPKSK